uniref:OKR_DC_1 domain-containing protein n=1 Tax=Macrostomum lignano TaxID=282301 RepID=A0A1I8FDT2_9PLAT
AGIKVIIDEAWYAFARFHPAFRPTALGGRRGLRDPEQSQDPHRLSPRPAWFTLTTRPLMRHLFRENFNMYASTSPQYGLIASLDVGRKQAVDGGLTGCWTARKINSTGVFAACWAGGRCCPRSCRQDGIRLDPTKLTVDISKSGYSAQELQQILFESMGTTGSKVSRLFDRDAPAGQGPAAAPQLLPHQRRSPASAASLPAPPCHSTRAASGSYCWMTTAAQNQALLDRVCCDADRLLPARHPSGGARTGHQNLAIVTYLPA